MILEQMFDWLAQHSLPRHYQYVTAFLLLPGITNGLQKGSCQNGMADMIRVYTVPRQSHRMKIR
jgi:hypothetical protein